MPYTPPPSIPSVPIPPGTPRYLNGIFGDDVMPCEVVVTNVFVEPPRDPCINSGIPRDAFAPVSSGGLADQLMAALGD
jgi:hypothetical protein